MNSARDAYVIEEESDEERADRSVTASHCDQF